MTDIVFADEIRFYFTPAQMAAAILASDPFQDQGLPCWQCPGCAEEFDTRRAAPAGSHSPSCIRGDW